MKKTYEPASRDIKNNDRLRELYIHHLASMTAESLTSQGDIAKELAWRDFEFEILANHLAELEVKHAEKTKDLRKLIMSLNRLGSLFEGSEFELGVSPEFTIMPTEPTEEIIEAMCAIECKQCFGDCKNGPYKEMYQAIIKAMEL